MGWLYILLFLLLLLLLLFIFVCSDFIIGLLFEATVFAMPPLFIMTKQHSIFMCAIATGYGYKTMAKVR